MTETLKVTVYDGKYTVVQTDQGLRALRYGEEWRDLTGDGLVLALAMEVEELRQQAEVSKGVITEWERDMKGTLATLEMERAENTRLLKALTAILKDSDTISYHTPHLGTEFWDEAHSVIAQATGRAA